MVKPIALAGIALTLLAAAAPAEAGRSRRYAEDGTASWYGPRFQGKPTASGETYDMEELSAAHPSLPFDTIVEVVNLENGRTVHVRINDRTARSGEHIIDLSARAARALEIGDSGIAHVRVMEVGG
jgi:rare lipoprotein A